MPFGLEMSQNVFREKNGPDLETMSWDNEQIDNVYFRSMIKTSTISWRLPDANVFVNRAKRTGDQKEIHFFGTVFTENELHPDLLKVTKIKSLPSPNNVAELQKVLGIYGTIYPLSIWPHSIPRWKFLKKDSQYKWTSSHQKSLQQIKWYIQHWNVVHFDPQDTSSCLRTALI